MGKGTNYVKKPTLLDAIVHSGRLLKHTRDIKRGEVAPDRLDASYQGVRACMEKGSNRRLVRRMDDFVNTIKKEITNAQT